MAMPADQANASGVNSATYRHDGAGRPPQVLPDDGAKIAAWSDSRTARRDIVPGQDRADLQNDDKAGAMIAGRPALQAGYGAGRRCNSDGRSSAVAVADNATEIVTP